ncbi:hypothetical protein DFH09DRAFT_1101481 [Mycena vulgaris]|nr:hypothetical protein DFH09DRAFT_1101481 [Mycena vulgaris]
MGWKSALASAVRGRRASASAFEFGRVGIAAGADLDRARTGNDSLNEEHQWTLVREWREERERGKELRRDGRHARVRTRLGRDGTRSRWTDKADKRTGGGDEESRRAARYGWQDADENWSYRRRKGRMLAAAAGCSCETAAASSHCARPSNSLACNSVRFLSVGLLRKRTRYREMADDRVAPVGGGSYKEGVEARDWVCVCSAKTAVPDKENARQPKRSLSAVRDTDEFVTISRAKTMCKIGVPRQDEEGWSMEDVGCVLNGKGKERGPALQDQYGSEKAEAEALGERPGLGMPGRSYSANSGQEKVQKDGRRARGSGRGRRYFFWLGNELEREEEQARWLCSPIRLIGSSARLLVPFLVGVETALSEPFGLQGEVSVTDSHTVDEGDVAMFWGQESSRRRVMDL